jgi:hypothetical protein
MMAQPMPREMKMRIFAVLINPLEYRLLATGKMGGPQNGITT